MNEIGLANIANNRSSAPSKPADGLKDTSDAAASSAKTERNAEAPQTEENAQQLLVDRKEAGNENENSVENAVAKLNDYVQNTERTLEFQVDEDSGETVVKVFDKTSEELIRQIPNEEALELAQRLNQEEPLMLFSAQV